MTPGSTFLPVHHLSVRVPWHDNLWNGTICNDPLGNSACLRLENIHLRRDDAVEIAHRGARLNDENVPQPPCVRERATFMSPVDHQRTLEHAYSKTHDSHRHFKPTLFQLPAYSAACVPFRWMLIDEARDVSRRLDVLFHEEAEQQYRDVMGFNSSWVQEVGNQRRLLDTFFSAVVPEQSLAFFYAKEVPFSEDNRRVLIGIGRVDAVGNAVEYEYAHDGPTRSMIWERNVHHSIRPVGRDGFLLPYHAALARAAEDPDVDPASLCVFVPSEYFDAFSYGSEHVTHDAAIAILLSALDGLQRASRCLHEDVGPQTRWISDRLGELWRLRGAFPGLGAALHAFSLDHANLFAFEITRHLNPGEDPWPLVERAIADPESLGTSWAERIGATTARRFAEMKPQRRKLLELLARFDLTNEQAERFYVVEERRKAGIDCSDADLIANPYLLYEEDRRRLEPVSVATVDRGCYMPATDGEHRPLPPESRMDERIDSRRVRAYLTSVLEARALHGDTLTTQVDAVIAIRGLEINPPCPVDGELLELIEAELEETSVRILLDDEEPAWQLKRLADASKRIRHELQRRAERGRRHEIAADWGDTLDAVIDFPRRDDRHEERARREKVAALEELAAARVSVLIGPAGTGKTTLLGAFCSHPDVAARGVLLLAPTGKARVQLENAFERAGKPTRARTIAEFLVPSGRYEPLTGVYSRSDAQPTREFGTIIVDEASMLTEDQLDAVLDAVRGVDRFILVGDPRQLPPIGVGRPFVDLVNFLAEGAPASFPRVGHGYAELTVRMRQRGETRDDLALAEWFSGALPSPAADEVWASMVRGDASPNVRFCRWETGEQLEAVLLQALAEEIGGISSPDDHVGFEKSLGGTESNGWVFFNNAWPERGRDGAGIHAEGWQVLSPVRGGAHGVVELNRRIQHHFRARARETAQIAWYSRRTPEPHGPEGIVYGDKVMCLSNHRRGDVWPEGSRQYVANGEIGMVVGQFKGSATGNKPPWKLEVEFSTQPAFKYSFYKHDFSAERGSKLELAYAVTIHKAQGSEFGVTFLVLPNPCWLLSPELLYTALTRQQQKVIVLHQGSLSALMAYTSASHSETARRLTNLFASPQPQEVDGQRVDARLIHRAVDGTLVRSKSEVVIADRLHHNRVEYDYERPFPGHDGSVRYPDFTIEDAATGDLYLWEHLGMLGDPHYARAWERKRQWYADSGVLPLMAGGGPNGTLITTQDDERGGIDSAAIDELVRQL